MSRRKPPRSKITFLDLDKYLGSPSVIGVRENEEDEIERQLRKIRLKKLQKLADLELEKYLVETEKELEKLKAESKPKNSESILPNLDLTPQMARELAKLPEEEKNKVIETYMALKSAEKLGAAGAFIWPLLIGYARANPGSTQESMVEFAKAMADQLKTGFELARQTQQEQTGTVELAKTIMDGVKTGIELAGSGSKATYDPVELIKTFGELIKENVQRPLEELVQKTQPTPSPFERILMDDKLFNRAKELGMFGGGLIQQQIPADIQIEIERLRTEREKMIKDMEMKLEEIRQQHDRWVIEQQQKARLEERRWQVVEGLMQGPLGRAIQTMGNAAAAKISGGIMPQPIQIECARCGHRFYGSSDAKIVVCPNCNTPLMPAPEGPKIERGKPEVHKPAGKAESPSD